MSNLDKKGTTENEKEKFSQLLKSWYVGNKHIAKEILTYEEKIERQVLPADVLVGCIKYLATEYKDFASLLRTWKLLVNNDCLGFFQEVYCNPSDTTDYILLQKAANVLLDDVHFKMQEDLSRFYEPVILRLNEAIAQHPGLYYYLGRLYLDTNNPIASTREGVKSLCMGAAKGSSRCQHALYYIYTNEAGVSLDIDRGFEYLEQYQATGNYRCKIRLAYNLLGGEFFKQDIPRALQMLEEAAEEISPTNALLNLACYYYDINELNKALSYTIRYTECSTSEANYHYLWLLHQMILDELNPERPIPELGNEYTPIGHAYTIWRKLKSGQFINETTELLQQLENLESEYPHCGYYLALCYEEGLGVQPKTLQVINHLSHAEAYFIPAALKLAEYNEEGKGISINKEYALLLYEDVYYNSFYRHSFVAEKVKQLSSELEA